jgi:hypothetical protein
VKNNLVSLSIFCLAVSIVISGWLITQGFKNVEEKNQTQQQTKEIAQNQLLTSLELADYLGLSIEEIQKLGPIPAGEGQLRSELPYMKIGNKYYFSKVAIDKWLLKTDSVNVE